MIAIARIVLLLVKVILVFEEMFADFWGPPGPTQSVINLSNFLQAYIHYMIGAVVAVVVLLAAARSVAFRYRPHAARCHLGNIIKKVAVAGSRGRSGR